MTSTLFSELLNTSRLLTVLYDNLAEEIKTSELYATIAVYFEKYSEFNNISAVQSVDMYTNFITHFNKHCKQFTKTGNYPAANGVTPISITREEYDVVLLLSVLFTPHRYRIMQLLEKTPPAEKALFIGLGPGLELLLTKKNLKEIHTYDLSVNKFLLNQFWDIKINTELYTGQNEDYFDVIYLIELLEHLQDPFQLIAICNKSLKKGGKIIFTTATDIPQFDHLYNFPKDHSQFEEQIKALGFKVEYNEMIPHNYLTMELKPSNHFYIAEKIN